MDIVSLKYMLFLLISCLIYWQISDKYKKIFLLITSIFFVCLSGINNLLFIVLYSLALFCISKYCINKKRLVVAIIISLLPLCFSKYINFFINIFDSEIENINFSIIGLSFITFRAISFIVDNYKNEIKNNKLIDYLMYMLFFPTLICGPIEISSNFINEIDSERKLSWEDFVCSVFYILLGIVCKICIADRLIGIINGMYANADLYTYYCLIAIFSYSIYIYCDFAGYSYIAIGTAKLFGYELTNNFNFPYLSKSIKEFWNNWHISLNNWFTKYIYIPLGGNRKGELRKYINLMIVFIISGIWHGTGWGFIIWGITNGLLNIVGQIKNKKIKHINNVFINYLFTFVLISFTWIPFSQDTNTVNILNNLFLNNNFTLYNFALDLCERVGTSKAELIMIVLSIVAIAFIELLVKYKNFSLCIKKKGVIRFITMFILCMLIIYCGKYGNFVDKSGFLYNDF